jgi:enamine deaminase RidA (YjgF/YER057c/UK114 family)
VSVDRYVSTKGVESLPIISQYVIHDGVVHTLGITGDPAGDVRAQTRQVLERLDELLARAGTDRSRLISAMVWLADMRDFDEHNREWNDWVDVENPPVRACVEARLWKPGLRVEVRALAALPSG